MHNRSAEVWADPWSATDEYSPTGELKQTVGSRTYPVAYTYDYAGRLKTLTTWQHYPDTGAATTTWNYDAQRGWLSGKTYQSTNGPSYTYTPAGRLATRTWARSLVTTYTTNSAGDLASLSYSDGTPTVTLGYNWLGQRTNVTDAAGTHRWQFDTAGRLLLETNTAGLLAGLKVEATYDSLARRTNVDFSLQPSALSLSYDAASRLQTVTIGSDVAEYSHLANSALVEPIEFRHNGTTRMTWTNQYDALNRLTALGSVVAGGETVGFAYGYTPANQRQAVTNADGSYWVYAYDSLGQVTAGVKHWPDGSLVPAQQFSYSFDDIGNRQTTKTGGDANGHKLRTATYTANDLNQYTQRTVPGYVDVAGSASTDATVTVNSQPTHRRGDYFWAELAVTNETGPLHQVLANVAVINQGTNADLVATNVGHLLIPPTPETFTNDADGNLIADGLWTYEWDGENRLIHMLSRTELPETARTDLRFTYDHQGRRISKTVSNLASGNWSLITDHRFVYDGWNLLAVLNSDLSPVTSFTWGLDASGTEQGAGGVGGLLSIQLHTGTNAGTHFPCYDGNHNVLALVNAATGDLAAQYEYGPFHELARATGPLAQAASILAATKFHDWETGFAYYGRRYYSPSAGRWISADPIAEEGGKNLYGFVGNEPATRIDPNGLFIWLLLPLLAGCSSEQCMCKDVTVTFQPGGGSFEWGWVTNSNASWRRGNNADIKWTVTGNPRKCKYFQIETGTVNMYNLDRVAVPAKGGSWEGREVLRSAGSFAASERRYSDYIGADFQNRVDDGLWIVTHSELSIEFKCESSNGSTKSKKEVIPANRHYANFPPP